VEAEQLLGLTDLVVPSHEAGQLDREIVGGRLERAQGREVIAEPLDPQLEQVLGAGQVLETMAPHIHQGEAGREPVLDQCHGRLRQQDLVPVGGARHPGGSVDVEAEIVVADQGGLPGMHAHSNPHARSLRPGVRVDRPLGTGRPGAGGDGAGKDDEERVSLGVDLSALVRLERLSQQPLVFGEYRAPTGAGSASRAPIAPST